MTFSFQANLAPGSSIPINVSALSGMYNLNTTVTVQSISSESMTFTTVPGHLLYPATIAFSACGSGKDVAFSIRLTGNYPRVTNRIAFNRGGGHFANAQWSHFSDQVAKYCPAAGK